MRRWIFIYLIAMIATTSCKKAIDVPFPNDRLLTSAIFTSNDKAAGAMAALYGLMINGTNNFCNGLTTVYAGLSSDELRRYNPTTIHQEFMTNQLTPSNTQVKNIWNSSYKIIYNSNAVLEGLLQSTALSDSIKSQYTAECRFIRAFCFFYLINTYGDVPLTISTDYGLNAAMSRTSKDEVYNFVTAELEAIASQLPSDYRGEKTRPTKWAAKALLARIYLYRQQWQKAEASASEVITSGLFTPLQSVNLSFVKESKEAIWQLSPVNGYMQETRQLRPSGTTPQVSLDPLFIASFPQGDQRRSRWVDSVTFQSTKYYYPGKYKNTATAVSEYYVMLRASELYLIRAEARLMQSNSDALSDMNIIRSRAGAPLISSVTPEIIEKERRYELFGEWAHRWFDLKRTGRASLVLGYKPTWQATDELYPIPLDDIISNYNLTQNPGY